MLERFKRRARGTTEAPTGDSAFPEPQSFTPYVLVYSYDATAVTVRRYDALGEGEPELAPGKVHWVRVVGVHDEAFVRAVGKRFCLHPLLMDDVLARGHRPVLEEYDSGIFVLLRLLGYDEAHKRVLAEQVCLVASDGYALTFQERETNLWDALASKLEKGGGRLTKRGREHLTHALIAAVLDEYILTLGRLAEDIEELEQTILSGANGDTLTETYRLKREVLFLHRSLWPLREVLGRYLADESNTADPGVALLWNDIRQDVYQVLDAVETLREMLSEMVGLSMTKAELRMNAVGQYLTLVATIFLPLNFLVGFFGMNFDNLPLKSEEWGIYALMGGMALTIVGMTLYFYRKHWIANTKVD
ncbi:MAG: magnesium/cobalt transporter CorA [Solidesulfovibrio sp.]|uniref:magnesium/cobalt transporter CorA n=1 Tax=Solidesulfovibrio sp. TaxID=2910990 RepID=UPI002B20B0D6|nr:magnesium/cobalt transporter CorA [Solidesulfovibrio sp.]MEA4858544.1 magnesium/cobalt transporter CorA [Solidesulfovibrio sp.]